MNEECRNKLRGMVYELYGTQQSFSKAINWRPGKISSILTGKYIPTTREASQIYKALRMTSEQYDAIFLQ
jgi:hypothetical protein